MSDTQQRSSTPESLEVTLTEAWWFLLCSCQGYKGTLIFLKKSIHCGVTWTKEWSKLLSASDDTPRYEPSLTLGPYIVNSCRSCQWCKGNQSISMSLELRKAPMAFQWPTARPFSQAKLLELDWWIEDWEPGCSFLWGLWALLTDGGDRPQIKSSVGG